MMSDFLQGVLGPYYLQIKFIHLAAVMVWLFSTSVAYVYYLVPAFKAWRKEPDDQSIKELRNWTMERFDDGARLEHYAFPIILITGPLLYLLSGYSTADDWMLLKLMFVIGLFIPIEILDYYISHFGGAKKNIRKEGNDEKYERYVRLHWNFFVYITAPISVLGLTTVYLAVVKPSFS